MKTTFTLEAFEEYVKWGNTDRKKFNKIADLIKNIEREGLLKGLGHPEKLKHKRGYTREIDKFNRLEYDMDEYGNLEIISCKGHHDDK